MQTSCHIHVTYGFIKRCRVLCFFLCLCRGPIGRNDAYWTAVCINAACSHAPLQVKKKKKTKTPKKSFSYKSVIDNYNHYALIEIRFGVIFVAEKSTCHSFMCALQECTILRAIIFFWFHGLAPNKRQINCIYLSHRQVHRSAFKLPSPLNQTMDECANCVWHHEQWISWEAIVWRARMITSIFKHDFVYALAAVNARLI